jgi:hypothetical protein
MPNTSRANSRRINPIASNALAMIVVEEIDKIAPRKIASILLQPSQRPASYPSRNMAAISTTAATTAATPTSRNFRKLK